MTICAPIPAKTAANQTVESDYNRLVSGFTSAASEMAKYRDLFFSLSGIADGMGYGSLAEADRDEVWAAIDDRVQSVVELPDPADIPVDQDSSTPQWSVSLTRAEAIDTFAANVAHSLYHDVNDTFPWKLNGYDNEALKFLFDPARRMADGSGDGQTGTEWEVDGGGPDYGKYVHETVDHSINQSYDIAWSVMSGAGTQITAIDLLLKGTLGESIHASTIHPWKTTACTVDHMFNMTQPWVSRSGCNSAGRVMRSLCSSVNIPTMCITGRIAPNAAHNTVAWPWFNLVMLHGDDHYLPWKGTGYAKGGNALVPYDEFETDVLSEAAGSQAGADAASRMRMIHLWTKWPGLWKTTFANPDRGWPYVQNIVDPYLNLPSEQPLLDKMYQDLAQLTGSDGAYIAPEEGTLEIDIAAPVYVPWWTMTPDPDTGTGTRDGVGGITEVVPAGSYTVEWWDNVEGFNPVPVSETKDVTDGQTTVFGPCIYTAE